ncbi:hypothetical protein OK016_14610 [Vibrio chagasii]|nr:hypothetical protein [Vibrio chagasii]
MSRHQLRDDESDLKFAIEQSFELADIDAGYLMRNQLYSRFKKTGYLM